MNRSSDLDMPYAELVGALFRTVGRFRRQVRRIAGQSFDAEALTSSQAEFVRLVGRNPGLSVKAAAAELNLVPNTVSTLVSTLVDAGLLVREKDATDRRATRLSLTHSAQAIADRTRRRRHETLSAAIDSLTPDERAQLRRGLELIERLTDILGSADTANEVKQ